jgi:hypothetical protein
VVVRLVVGRVVMVVTSELDVSAATKASREGMRVALRIEVLRAETAQVEQAMAEVAARAAAVC